MEYNLTLSTDNEFNVELEQSNIVVEQFMNWGSIIGDITTQSDLIERINSAIYDDTIVVQNIIDLDTVKADKSELSAYALKKELPDGVDLSTYALKTEIPTIPDHTVYALKTEIPTVPNLTDYALKSEIPLIPDHSIYALKTEIPLVSGLASETYVDDLIGDINTILDSINGEVI